MVDCNHDLAWTMIVNKSYWFTYCHWIMLIMDPSWCRTQWRAGILYYLNVIVHIHVICIIPDLSFIISSICQPITLHNRNNFLTYLVQVFTSTQKTVIMSLTSARSAKSHLSSHWSLTIQLRPPRTINLFYIHLSKMYNMHGQAPQWCFLKQWVFDKSYLPS